MTNIDAHILKTELKFGADVDLKSEEEKMTKIDEHILKTEFKFEADVELKPDEEKIMKINEHVSSNQTNLCNEFDTLPVGFEDNKQEMHRNLLPDKDDEHNEIITGDVFSTIQTGFPALNKSFKSDSATCNNASWKDCSMALKHCESSGGRTRPTRRCKSNTLLAEEGRDGGELADSSGDNGSDWEQDFRASKVGKHPMIDKCKVASLPISKRTEKCTPNSMKLPLLKKLLTVGNNGSNKFYMDLTKSIPANGNNSSNQQPQSGISNVSRINLGNESQITRRHLASTAATSLNMKGTPLKMCDKLFGHINQNKVQESNTAGCGRRWQKYNQDLLCHLCGKRFKSPVNLNTHINKHLNIKPYKCADCDKTFGTFTGRKYHHLVTHEKKRAELKFLCVYCGYITKSRSHIAAHEAAHEVPEEGDVPTPFKCPICDKGYISQFSMKKHVKDRHGNKKCQVCSEICGNKSKLRSHIKQAHGFIKPKGVTCGVCKKTIYQKLSNHMREVHTAPKFFCDICDKGCKMKHQIRQHMITHSDDRPIACDRCDERFKRKTHLKQHLESKHGEIQGGPRPKRKAEKKTTPAKRGRKKKTVD